MCIFEICIISAIEFGLFVVDKMIYKFNYLSLRCISFFYHCVNSAPRDKFAWKNERQMRKRLSRTIKPSFPSPNKGEVQKKIEMKNYDTDYLSISTGYIISTF